MLMSTCAGATRSESPQRRDALLSLQCTRHCTAAMQVSAMTYVSGAVSSRNVRENRYKSVLCLIGRHSLAWLQPWWGSYLRSSPIPVQSVLRVV